MTGPDQNTFSDKLDHMIAVYDKAGPMAEAQTKTLRQCRAALQTVNSINERLASEAYLLREDAKGLAQVMRADDRDLDDPLWQDVIAFLESF